eukprot:5967712-Prymnesium_polylepis.1
MWSRMPGTAPIGRIKVARAAPSAGGGWALRLGATHDPGRRGGLRAGRRHPSRRGARGRLVGGPYCTCPA